MPYLMLEFNAERLVTEKAGQMVPTGDEKISFRMIDTETGKVVTLSADAKNVQQVERPANFGESHTASQVLGQEPGKPVSQHIQDRLENLEAERDSYRQKYMAAQTEIDKRKEQVKKREEEIVKLRQKVTTPMEDELIAAALDGYIYELAAGQQFSSYEDAKKLYRRLTGTPWSDDGSGEDDEEGDCSGNTPGFATGGLIGSGTFSLVFVDEDQNKKFFNFMKGILDHKLETKFTWHYDEISDPVGDLKKYAEQIERFGLKRDDELRDIDFDFSHRHSDHMHLDGGGRGLFQYNDRFRLVDDTFLKGIKDASEQMKLLGKKFGRSAEQQRALYEAWFGRAYERPTRIPNFKLDAMTQRIKGKKKKPTKEQRRQWRQQQRQNRPLPGR